MSLTQDKIAMGEKNNYKIKNDQYAGADRTRKKGRKKHACNLSFEERKKKYKYTGGIISKAIFAGR